MRNRSVATVAIATIAALGLAACGSSNEPDTTPGAQTSSLETKAGGAGGEVGVFTWWAAGSEKKGLDELEKLFKEKYPNDTFVNLAVAGGAGSNAKAKLASDLQNNQPPDSFQGHAGAELLDYIDAEQIEPVNDVIDALGGASVFPQSLLDRLTVDGNIYSVPSNIHRSNVVWANAEVLKKAGITQAPADMKAWIADMEKVKASGVSTPLSVAGTWTQTHLFESVLLADLGVEKYNGLFDGSTKWDAPEVKTAVNDFKTVLSYANTASDGDDWPVATDMVIDGKAAYNVMGDWAVAQFNDKGKKEQTDYTYFPTPGTDGVFLFLADSFTLPKGAKNPGGSKDWLSLVGSAEGQQAFNIAKGSIPARTDVAPTEFPPYQQSAMESFKNDQIASSIQHGAAVPLAWLTDINAAISKFYTNKDEATLVTDLATAATKYVG
ncbi:extracellular solute-binding protein [Intrasporangium calvum]|uniref:Probable sugar-binding periplasmic protein n=1 Tax=Intrasporangium calvum TaxID=53358 RepID=A0ABT5GKP0_9MICO|nr:extracellular solute-binding protein [Intrasporangium calvum]MDC5698591.1 extracellular solute-binding protein [Intrasporangium calvum]